MSSSTIVSQIRANCHTDENPTRIESKSATTLVESALKIAVALCKEAYWNGNQCTWVGRSILECRNDAVPTVTSIGGDLYFGSAGVGLFLAELAAITNEPKVLATALGALNHANTWVNNITSSDYLGLYSGAVGIAVSQVYVGRLFSNEALIERGTQILRSMNSNLPAQIPLDLLAGASGTIQGVLSLKLNDEWIPFVEKLADYIVNSALGDSNELWWPFNRASGNSLGFYPLTGLSHGSAGIGLALLEAAALTGRQDLLDAGKAAFRYENKWFSKEEENWADLRQSEDNHRMHNNSDLRYSVAWCHGAPGIGLARLRALQLIADQKDWICDVHAAVNTVRRRLSFLLSDKRADASLCHGIAGLLEFLLVAARELNDHNLMVEVDEAWNHLVLLHDTHLSWPTGFVSGGKSPSLMLGIAGTGHAMLRAARPRSVKSVLLITLD